ncbi:MAG: response regulator [Desulfobulbaceae bacterium]|nr:response regulator [Desulfobulbaceae bacterium]
MDNIFFVDDENHLLRAIERIFADEEGLNLCVFDNPEEALKRLETSVAAVVVTDQKMPSMQGTDFLEIVKARWPDAIRIIMSGYADLDVMMEGINKNNIFRFINKPFNNSELVLAVREALNHYNVSQENKRLHAVTRKQNDELVLLTRQLESKVYEKTAQIRHNEEQLQELVKKLEQALDGSVRAMAMAVETRDPYTAGHQKRVAELACAIAGEMGLSADVIEGIRLAGIVHDLGKIYVPAEILNRPGRLSSIERELIHTHPQVGFDILKGIEFPWPISQIVLQHHERINGSGYPNRLANNEILLEAKIMAVADVVEAMSSHRPYRPAPGLDLALAEIEKNTGEIYDQSAAQACLTLFRDKGFSMTTWHG